MIGTVKLLFAGCVLATLPTVALIPDAVQDPEPRGVQDPFQQEAVWNFAVLQYTNEQNQTVEHSASTIAKMWLVSMGNGRMRLEIFFQNRDYSQIDLRSFSVIRRSAAFTAVDVPVIRTSIEGMAFPAFK